MIRFLQTPGPVKKIVLGGLLVVICAAMVIVLVPGGILGDAFGFQSNLGQNVVAKVGSEEISIGEVQQQARSMGRQQFPRGLPQALMPFLYQRAADNLITQHAMVVQAERLGLTVSDAELQDELQHGSLSPELFPNGTFVGEQAYEDFVSQFNMSVPQFEQAMKDDLLRRKLMDMVTGAVTVSNTELEQQFEKDDTKVKFDYAVLTADQLKKQIHPSDAELKSFFERNKQTYVNSIPEQRKVSYILIDTSKLSGQVQVSPGDLQRYYNEHMDEYRVPEQVEVRHILIKTPPPGPDGKVDPKAVDAARQKAEDILKQLHAGADFAKLAEKDSQDTASAKNGGSLGWIQRGQTVPEFEKVAFSLPKGSTSGIVQTSYGFHIIHVDDKQEAHVKPLSEVQAQIQPLIAQDKVSQMAQNLSERVQSAARSMGMDKAAAQNNLQVTSTGFISRNDSLPGMGQSPEFMDAIFSAAQNAAPDMTNLRQGYVVYQVTAVKPPQTPTFEQIRSRVESEFVNQQATAMLAQKTQELSDRARALHDLKKAAKEQGATLKTSELVTRKEQVPDVGAMSGPASVAFTMKPGEISGPIDSGSSGVVLSLVDREAPSQADFQKQKSQVREQVLQQKRDQMLQLFIANLREQMEKSGKIQINQQVLKQLTTPHNEAS
ncbi:MAG TPA: peptidyl-prolyl cis-trans isomerase [Terriglobales bacterium]|nr:peptidyl-prolyl cis-trans isomerase [Terriglobales bacterium]